MNGIARVTHYSLLMEIWEGMLKRSEMLIVNNKKLRYSRCDELLHKYYVS